MQECLLVLVDDGHVVAGFEADHHVIDVVGVVLVEVEQELFEFVGGNHSLYLLVYVGVLPVLEVSDAGEAGNNCIEGGVPVKPANLARCIGLI